MSETQSLDDVTVVFDLDGTLVDTAPDLIAALNHSLAADGLAPVPASDVRGMIGQGAKAMIRKGLGFHHEAFDEECID
ncbi:MAG: HAD hydrolase-like protein, partial [Pseudomonadota bacterium]